MTKEDYTQKPAHLGGHGMKTNTDETLIKHLKENYDVINVSSETDYRRITLNQSKTYFTPINRDTEEEFNSLFDKINPKLKLPPFS